MNLVLCLSQPFFVPINMLSAEALHETWPFEHLSSYLFRT